MATYYDPNSALNPRGGKVWGPTSVTQDYGAGTGPWGGPGWTTNVTWGWLDDGTGTQQQQQGNQSVATGIDPNELANALYGKPIPISALGLARIGTAGLIWGPYFNGTSASFAVSFGFPANVDGTRKVYEVSLDSKVVWSLAAGSAAGALDAAGFLSEPFTCRFYGGTMTQGADALEIERFGTEAVAYRPQMMLWFQDLPLAQFGGKVPFVSCKIGDTTDGADPADGINLAECFERVAYSPWVEYDTTTFETNGITEVVGAMILSEDQGFLAMLGNFARVYRSLDILQTDKLRVNDRGTNVTPDLTLSRDRIVAESGVNYSRQAESSVPRQLELLTIDVDADYVFMPSLVSRPRDPVPVTSSVGKETLTLPIVLDAHTRMSLATYAKYQEENARKRIQLRGMLYANALEPGDLFSLNSVADGFDPIETFKVVETSHNADWTVDISGETIMRCSLPSDPQYEPVAYYEIAGVTNVHTTTVDLGEPSDDRLIVLVLSNYKSISPRRAITGVTLGGVACSIITSIESGDTGINPNPSCAMAIATLAVPAGTSASVSVTSANNVSGVTVGVYALKALSSMTAFNTAAAESDVSNPSTTINVPHNGVVIAGYTGVGASPGAATWTGLNTETYDQMPSGFTVAWVSGASQVNMVAQTARPISVAGSSDVAEIIVAASFA